MYRNYKILSTYSLPALLTPLPFIPLSTTKITGSNTEAANGAKSFSYTIY